VNNNQLTYLKGQGVKKMGGVGSNWNIKGSYYLVKIEDSGNGDKYTELFGPYSMKTTRNEIQKQLEYEEKNVKEPSIFIKLYVENSELFLEKE
jgi:hypothetical protein